MTALPDLGRALACFIALRAVGWTRAALAARFRLSEDQVRLLLDTHGDPPKVAGRPSLAPPPVPRPGFIDRSLPEADR